MIIKKFIPQLNTEWPVATQTLSENLEITGRSFETLSFNSEVRVLIIPKGANQEKLMVQQKGIITRYGSELPFTSWTKTAGVYLFETEYDFTNGSSIGGTLSQTTNVTLPSKTPAVKVQTSVPVLVQQNDENLETADGIYILKSSSYPLQIKPVDPINPNTVNLPTYDVALPVRDINTFPTFQAYFNQPEEIISLSHITDLKQRLAWHAGLEGFRDDEFTIVVGDTAFYSAKPNGIIEDWG